MKIIITGGSGFIGTNLIEFLLGKGYEVLNIDINEPRNKKHTHIWKEVDICDLEKLRLEFEKFKPEYVIHLAAVTDLKEDDGLNHYQPNIRGVENIVLNCYKHSEIRRVIFASSMLVNEIGYKPVNDFDYNPKTTYGRSKVIGEKIVFENKNNLTEFCIVRPTSIWGEWFSEPYRNFFDYVLTGKYFHPGKMICTRTYGYVGNVIYQIHELMLAGHKDIDSKIFYLGDKPATKINEWADSIARIANVKKPIRVPFFIFKGAAFFGDFLKWLGLRFPMTSFRLKNMTTNHIVNLDNTYEVCGNPPYSNQEAIERTLDWLRK